MLDNKRCDSYPKVWALGCGAIDNILRDPVVVQEKIDGSQCSFGRDEDGVWFKSKKVFLPCDGQPVEGMFKAGVEVVRELGDRLPLGITFRAEYMQSEKHNTLRYNRIPCGHLCVFDAQNPDGSYWHRTQIVSYCEELGLDVVPELCFGFVDVEQLKELLTTESYLGGQQVEGVVVKNYKRYTHTESKPMFGKLVRQSFKEQHAAGWKVRNPNSNDIIEQLREKYTTQARWRKAMQHMEEAGQLERTPKDIGQMCIEVKRDLKKECEIDIKETLWRWAWPRMSRGVTKGLPEWYKEELLKGLENE